MQKNELSAWTLLLGSAVLGSITTVALGGCKPPTSRNVDISTGDYVASNVTADASNAAGSSSNLTAASSNVTTSSPATAVENPIPITKTEPSPAKATTLGTSAGEVATPQDVLGAGGDWPQWGGTREKNNAPNVKHLPAQWNIGKFDRQTGEWDNATAENIRWIANLGSQAYGNPVVASGRVFVGTNNNGGRLKRYASSVDLGCLLAIDEKTGDFLWQHCSEKLRTGRVHDWPQQGICCSPLVEGERLWFVTSRGEVRCLDTEGFYDNQDDGDVQNEIAKVAELMNPLPAEAYAEATAALAEGTLTDSEKMALDASQAHAATLEGLASGSLTDAAKQELAEAGEAIDGDLKVETITEGKVWQATGNFGGVDRELTIKQIGPRIQFFKSLGVHDKRDADVIWVYNMMGPEMGISQHNMCSCSVTSYGDLLFVNTSNGQDESHINLPAPNAPSFICMDKNTGEVLWTDRSPGKNILHGQWSSPTVAVVDGVAQVLFAGGDGIVYSFAATRGEAGNPEFLWKFDCNPKTTKWVLGGVGTRNNIIATPVVYDGFVYVAVGQDPEHGEGQGHLWCVDPTKHGDVSPTLAMKIDDDGKRVPIAHKRIQAVEPEKGEVEVDNPNSAVVWHYSIHDGNNDGEIDFEETMHRSMGTVAIKDDVLYITDFSGLVHCLDAKGSKDGKAIVHFTYDMLAQSWGSPLIADGRVFIGDEDGDVSIFDFGPDNKEPIEEIQMRSSVYTTPVGANETIFICTKDKLFSIGLSK